MDKVNSSSEKQMSFIKIDIIADLICPWCYFGCLFLEKSLKKRPHIKFLINWMPFYLKPKIPLTGECRKYYIKNKFGVNYNLIESNITHFALKNKIKIHLDKIKVMPNTKLLNRFIIKKNNGLGSLSLANCIMYNFFVKGLDLTNKNNLQSILKDSIVLDFERPCTNQFPNEIYLNNINSIPLFIFNNKWKISGVKNIKIFENVIDLASRDTIFQ